MDAIKVSKLKKVFESSRRLGWLRSEKVEVVSVREVTFDVGSHEHGVEKTPIVRVKTRTISGEPLLRRRTDGEMLKAVS